MPPKRIICMILAVAMIAFCAIMIAIGFPVECMWPGLATGVIVLFFGLVLPGDGE